MNESLTVSRRVADFAKTMEGFASEAYLDTLASPPVWTIGYGDTSPDARTRHQPITEQEAEEDLLRHLNQFGAGVKGLVTVPLTQGQFDALCDFTYNCGLAALKDSHLLMYLNAGHPDLAAGEFPKWNHAGGVERPGLTRRRAQEREWFIEETSTSLAPPGSTLLDLMVSKLPFNRGTMGS